MVYTKYFNLIMYVEKLPEGKSVRREFRQAPVGDVHAKHQRRHLLSYRAINYEQPPEITEIIATLLRRIQNELKCQIKANVPTAM